MNNDDGLDTRLQQLYQQIPKEQPSQAIDTAILLAAQQSIANKSTWRPVWGIAASMVMMSSLVWYWQAQQPQELARAVAVSAPTPQAKPAPQESLETNAKDENAAMAADDFGGFYDQAVEEKITVNKPAERSLLQAKSKVESAQTEEIRQLPAAAPVISLEKTQAEANALVAEPQAEQPKKAIGKGESNLSERSIRLEPKLESLNAKQNIAKDIQGKENLRTIEQIRLVFDKNFVMFNEVYQQALKEQPNLGEGVVRLNLTISANGEVIECKIVSSELNYIQLEHKIIEIVKTFNFGEARAKWEGEYPINLYKN